MRIRCSERCVGYGLYPILGSTLYSPRVAPSGWEMVVENDRQARAGVVVGALVGSGIGILIGSTLDNTALGIGIGLGLGVALGTALVSLARRR